MSNLMTTGGYLLIDGEAIQCEFRWERGAGRVLESITGQPVHHFEASREFYPVNSWAPASYHHEEGIVLTLDDCKELGLLEATWETE